MRTGSHGPSDLSPVFVWPLHYIRPVGANFGVQEFMGYSEQMLRRFSRITAGRSRAAMYIRATSED
ncbi:hypothetical protein KCP75_07835 [Salmonella enterica subsp. enterica]|nr:hypothetical protein KCP75_07835 [Salmonella enterica subsp. enterica]